MVQLSSASRLLLVMTGAAAKFPRKLAACQRGVRPGFRPHILEGSNLIWSRLFYLFCRSLPMALNGAVSFPIHTYMQSACVSVECLWWPSPRATRELTCGWFATNRTQMKGASANIDAAGRVCAWKGGSGRATLFRLATCTERGLAAGGVSFYRRYRPERRYSRGHLCCCFIARVPSQPAS